MSILRDFKKFALKGNMIDLAVAVIIGTAFGQIISSLVSDILMPPLGLLLGNVDFKDLSVVLVKGQPAAWNGGELVSEAVQQVTLNYGMFIQNVVDFMIIATVLFIVIRSYQKMITKIEELAASQIPSEPELTKEEELLTEIRDLLKKNMGKKFGSTPRL